MTDQDIARRPGPSWVMSGGLLVFCSLFSVVDFLGGMRLCLDIFVLPSTKPLPASHPPAIPLPRNPTSPHRWFSRFSCSLSSSQLLPTPVSVAHAIRPTLLTAGSSSR